MNDNEMLMRVNSVLGYLTGHPDYEPDSECEDRVNDLVSIRRALTQRINNK